MLPAMDSVIGRLFCVSSIELTVNGHCLIHELYPSHHSFLEHATYGTSCLSLAFLNPTTCHLSNLRLINKSDLSLLLAFRFLLSPSVGALDRPPWHFPQHKSLRKKKKFSRYSFFFIVR